MEPPVRAFVCVRGLVPHMLENGRDVYVRMELCPIQVVSVATSSIGPALKLSSTCSRKPGSIEGSNSIGLSAAGEVVSAHVAHLPAQRLGKVKGSCCPADLP